MPTTVRQLVFQPIDPEYFLCAFVQLVDGTERLSAQGYCLLNVLLTQPMLTFEGGVVRLHRRPETSTAHTTAHTPEMIELIDEQLTREEHFRRGEHASLKRCRPKDVAGIVAAFLTLVGGLEDRQHDIDRMAHVHEAILHGPPSESFMEALIVAAMAYLLPPNDVTEHFHHSRHFDLMMMHTRPLHSRPAGRTSLIARRLTRTLAPRLQTEERREIEKLFCTLDAPTWSRLRTDPVLAGAFEEVPSAELTQAAAHVPSLVQLSTEALLPVSDVDFVHSMRFIHERLLTTPFNRAAAVLLELLAPFGERTAAWLARAAKQEASRDSIEMALVCADALGRLTRVHAGSSQLVQKKQIAALEATRRSAISSVAEHVVLLGKRTAGPSVPVASMLLPTSLDEGMVPLHPATLAAVNTVRMECGQFDELYDVAGNLETLDRSLVHEAASLAEWSGLAVRFPEAMVEWGGCTAKRRVLGGKWRCTLELPADMEMSSAAKKRKACVGLALTTTTRQQELKHGSVACSLSVRPMPFHFEMLYTCSILRGHAPRVTFTPPGMPLDNPLVHAPSGLVSPLALEHLELVLRGGMSIIPTAATIVELLELLITDTPLATLVHACGINEDACWRVCRDRR